MNEHGCVPINLYLLSFFKGYLKYWVIPLIRVPAKGKLIETENRMAVPGAKEGGRER